MKILIASDSFKDALPARDVCAAIDSGLRYALPDAQIVEFPLADGGEGTAEVLLSQLGGETQKVTVKDPLFRPVSSSYARLDNGRIALVELAAASGIQLLKTEERSARHTTTFGTGQLIRAALDSHPEKLVIGLGSSATNDGGMGMAAALGYRFLDVDGRELEPIGQNLGRVHSIDDSNRVIRPGDLPVEVICDVTNPLTGPRGASRTYGPQKGASASDVEELEGGMQSYARVLADQFGRDFEQVPGAGAAGGMGAACLAYLGASLRPGVELVMELCDFDLHLEGTDLIVTGEGRIDDQTLHGKLIGGICKRAAQRKIPVVGLCGSLTASVDEIRQIGLAAAFSITPGPITLPEALQATGKNLERTAAQIGRLLFIR